MVDERTLQREVKTPLGIFTAGVRVRLIAAGKFGKAPICLDPAGYHPNGRCHKATVPLSWLSPAPWRPNPRECA